MANTPLSEISLDQPDHYTDHLVEVNAADNRVLASEDIYNKNGVLLARAGTEINKKMSATLVAHKLSKPIEHSITLENRLDGGDIMEDYSALFIEYPDIGKLNKNLQLSPVIEKLVLGARVPPLLLQKLTVMKERFPEMYQKTLFCSWLTVAMTRESGAPIHEDEPAMIAGLIHDVGMLHIDPEVVSKKGELSASEWRTIQSHVLVGQLIAKEINGLDQTITRAIIEHHEKTDGSGYPRRLTQEKLSKLGLVVGLADTIQALRVCKFKQQQRNLANALPYLHMNMDSYGRDAYRSAVKVIHHGGLKAALPEPEMGISGLKAALTARGLILNNITALIAEVYEELKGDHPSLTNSMGTMLLILNSSGLQDPELFGWLNSDRLDDGSEDKNGVLATLNDMEMMQNELQWQLSNLSRKIEQTLDLAKGETALTGRLSKLGGEIKTAVNALNV